MFYIDKGKLEGRMSKLSGPGEDWFVTLKPLPQ